MDLRPYIHTPEQLAAGIDLIRRGDLFYQPFILADEIEVGEGQNLNHRYQDVSAITDNNVFAPAYSLDRKQATDSAEFRFCNAEYRAFYEHIAETICSRLDAPIAERSFAEIGCNTGLNLFNLAARGAGSCHGYDWNDMGPTFEWLNGLLGTRVQFTHGHYDNLAHRFAGNVEVAEADVMVNTVFTQHQCDPLQFLCYLCDRARKGVFLWARVDPDVSKPPAIFYPAASPHDILDNTHAFPLNFNNGVLMTANLILLAFQRLGFEAELLPPYVPSDSPGWHGLRNGFRMFYAKRTSEIRSAYWGK